MLPKISVVTPNYNGAKFFEQTIQSVLSQGYPNLEYIVIDGGSTDNSVEIIKRYEKSIAYWISEKDSGHADALNKGFKKATGDVLCWINSDDMYFPWTFKVVSSIFRELKDVHWITGMPGVWNDQDELIKVDHQYFNKFTFMVSAFKPIQQESVFFTRYLWEKAGAYIDGTFRYMIDSELWSRFHQHEHLYNVNTCLGAFRTHSVNRSKLFFDQCIEEHKRAQDQLFQKSTPEIVSLTEKVKFLYRIKHSRLTRNFNFQVIQKIFFPKILEATRYNVLNKGEQGWIKGSTFFDYL